MKFSTRATYGLRAMLYLSDRYGEGAVSISQIAEDEKISAAYLEQILSRIKQKGWVKSVRGPRGGYVLSVRPSEISVAELLSALGENAAFGSVNSIRNTPKGAADLFWYKLSKGFTASLEKVSLAQIIGDAANPETASSPMHFSI